MGGTRLSQKVGAARASRARAVACRASKKVNKVVLDYSGGLDTSVILKWLQETYDCEVGGGDWRQQPAAAGGATFPRAPRAPLRP